MPLESDISNADGQLHVTFYTYQGEDKNYHGKPFCRIMVPGDKTNIIDVPVREDHKRRFPRQYQYFLMQTDPNAAPIGTTLEIWHQEQPSVFNEGQLNELQILKFRTVDQLAMASDSQIQRLGMGAAGLRERAKAYLIQKSQNIGAEDRAAQSAELADTKAQLAALQAQVAALMAKPPVADLPEKRRGCPPGGWPKKDKVNVEHNAATRAAGNE